MLHTENTEIHRVEFFKLFISPDENAFEPVVDVYYPIINDISHVDILKGNNYTTTSEALVGIISFTIYWREFIRDILQMAPTA